MPNAMDVVNEVYSAFRRGDVAGVMKLVSDEVDWRVVAGPSSLPYATTCRTCEEVGRYLEDLLAAEEIVQFEPREYIDAGNKIVVIGFVEVVIKETKKRFESEWVHIFTVEDDKITRWLEFFDTAAHG